MVCLDWLDPLRNTGQWLPEISEIAGGEEGLAVPRGRSRELSWEEVRDYAPEYLMIMPCAFGPERSWQEARDKLTVLPGWEELPAVRDERSFVFDGRIPSRHGAAGGGCAGGTGGGAAPGAVRGAGARRGFLTLGRSASRVENRGNGE